MRVIVHHGKRGPLSISIEIYIDMVGPAWVLKHCNVYDLNEETPTEAFLSIMNELPALLREAYDAGLAGEGFVLEQYDDSEGPA